MDPSTIAVISDISALVRTLRPDLLRKLRIQIQARYLILPYIRKRVTTSSCQLAAPSHWSSPMNNVSSSLMAARFITVLLTSVNQLHAEDTTKSIELETSSQM